MKKLLVLVAGALGLALGTAACNPVTPYAAVVNGSTISVSDLNTEMQAISDNPILRQTDQVAAQLQQGGRSLTGSAPGTFDASYAADLLARQIEYAVVEQELARRHLTVTAADLAAARVDLLNSGEFQSASFSQVPYDYQQVMLRRIADVTVLAADLAHVDITPAGIAAYAAAHRADLQQVCASWIAVNTLADAATVLNDLHAGRSFAAEAQAKSQDTNTSSTGGQLGCHPALLYGQLGAAVAQAVKTLPLDQPSGPVAAGQGLVILEVTTRVPLSAGEAATAIRDQLTSTAQLGQLVDPLIVRADISVDARYGRWVANGSNGPEVVPPTAPHPRSDART